MFKPVKAKKARKGFSLVELVIAILIIAVLVAAVFAGGSIIIRNSQISRTTSDLHNFSIAAETLLNENPMVANVDQSNWDTEMPKIVAKLNSLLAEDYRVETAAAADIAAADGNQITGVAGTADLGYVILKSAKTDAWGNNYFVLLDYADRNEVGISDFYVTVISAGPNAKTTLTEAYNDKTNQDDVILVAQYSDGSVSSVIYNQADTTVNALVDGLKYTGNGKNDQTALETNHPRVFVAKKAA